MDLPQTSDLVTSCDIYDATFSGFNTIVLGTFGKKVLFYCPLSMKHNNDGDLDGDLNKLDAMSVGSKFKKFPS